MAMDLIDGMEPLDFIPVGDVASTHRLLSSVGASLDLLHENGVLHRDLKPENILYASDADDAPIKLTDFFLKQIVSFEDIVTAACETECRMFIAPEVLQHRGLNVELRGPVDMWSCGVLLYILLCGYAPFDEEKLRSGLLRALEKRPVSVESIEAEIDQIKHRLRATGEREVKSLQVGEQVMDSLKALDHVAYVRFASVYRSFQDLAEFRDAIESLEAEPQAQAPHVIESSGEGAP